MCIEWAELQAFLRPCISLSLVNVLETPVAHPDLDYLYLALKEIRWVLLEPKQNSGPVWILVKRPLQRNSDHLGQVISQQPYYSGHLTLTGQQCWVRDEG